MTPATEGGDLDCPECQRRLDVAHYRRPAGRLWLQANEEHPDDPDRRRQRYHDLMVEHGLLVPGKQEPLPCGWPWHHPTEVET